MVYMAIAFPLHFDLVQIVSLSQWWSHPLVWSLLVVPSTLPLCPSLAPFSMSPFPYKLLLKRNLSSNCQLIHGEKFAGRNLNIFWIASYYQYIRVLYLGVFNPLTPVAPVKPS